MTEADRIDHTLRKKGYVVEKGEDGFTPGFRAVCQLEIDERAVKESVEKPERARFRLGMKYAQRMCKKNLKKGESAGHEKGISSKSVHGVCRCSYPYF